MKTKLANIAIILSLLMLLFWGMGCLSGCSHTKKAFSELSKKVDSVFVTRHDTSYRNKKDSSNTVIDLKGIDIYFGDTDENDLPHTTVIVPEVKGSSVTNEIQRQLSKKFPGKSITHVHIDSGTIRHDNITTTSSGKGSKVDSSHKITEDVAKKTTTDRRGANIMSTLIMWAIGIGLIIFLVLKFKSKIPIIKNL